MRTSASYCDGGSGVVGKRSRLVIKKDKAPMQAPHLLSKAENKLLFKFAVEVAEALRHEAKKLDVGALLRAALDDHVGNFALQVDREKEAKDATSEK